MDKEQAAKNYHAEHGELLKGDVEQRAFIAGADWKAGEGMRWIKASERLPADSFKNVIVRHLRTREVGLGKTMGHISLMRTEFVGWNSTKGDCEFKDVEWLDEQPQPPSTSTEVRMKDEYEVVCEDILKEVRRAKTMFKDNFVNQHEGYAVILEELDELWDEVKKNQKIYDLPAQRKEVIQCAAMCIRFAAELLPQPPAASDKTNGHDSPNNIDA